MPTSQQKEQPRMPRRPPSAGATTPAAGATPPARDQRQPTPAAGATSHTRDQWQPDPQDWCSDSDDDSTKTGARPAPTDEYWKHHWDPVHERWHGRGMRVGPPGGGSDTVPGHHTRANQADKLRKQRRKKEREQEDARDPAGATARAQRRLEDRAYNEALGAARHEWVVARRWEKELEAQAVTTARAADRTTRAAVTTARAAAKAAEEVQMKVARLQEIDPRVPEAFEEMGGSSSSVTWNRHEGWAHRQEWSWREGWVPSQEWNWQEGLVHNGRGGYIAPGQW